MASTSSGSIVDVSTREILEAVRRELGIDGSQPVVGFVGRLVREKGSWISSRRCVWFARSCRTLSCSWSGRPTPRSRTPLHRRWRDGTGSTSAAFSPGSGTDLPTLYGLMDVFVLPSARESFPRAPMEAAAMGVPCVLTDIPGCREVVEHGRSGLLVPVGSPPALARAILALLTRKNLARHLGDAARQRAIERFDEVQVFEIVKAAYARLMAESGLAPQASRRSIGALPGSPSSQLLNSQR